MYWSLSGNKSFLLLGLLLLSFPFSNTTTSATTFAEAVSAVAPPTRTKRKYRRRSANIKNNYYWTSPRQFLLRRRELRLDTLELATPTLTEKFQAAARKGKGLIFPSTFTHPTTKTTTSLKIRDLSRIMPATSTTTANDVLWFIPNLIGYLRVIMALTGFILMAAVPEQHWALATVLYVGSFVGDLFDGWAARKMDQCSIMGGLLDMITDRCATLGFLFILSGDYAPVDAAIGFPVYRLLFLGLMILDISSHWCQMYSSSLAKDGAHHKSEAGNEGRNILVQWFYKYYWFFGYLCVGAEFTYICLYITQHAQQDTMVYKAALYLLYACIPGCAAKQMVNLAQLGSACHVVAEHDAKERNSKKA